MFRSAWSRSAWVGLASLLCLAAAPTDAHASGVLFGLTTTQEASGLGTAIKAALSENFPETRFSYTVAGTSATLRSLEEGFLPFAVTHNASAEKALAAKGLHKRYPLFSNDFLLVGPNGTGLDCPDGIAPCIAALAKRNLPDLSRGDRSGTHLYELDLWSSLGIAPETLGSYRLASGGAANSLRICAVQACFTIVDEATFESGTYARLVEIARDPASNLYSLMVSNEAETGELAPVIAWLREALPDIAAAHGYRRNVVEDD